MTQAIEPVDRGMVDGKSLPGGFPSYIKERALVLCELTGSATRAHRQLDQEMQGSGVPTPDYQTIWAWARDQKNVIDAVTGDRKSELVAMSSDVMEVYAAEAIQAAPKLNPYQKVIAYGVSADKRIGWESAGHKGNQMNVQFNFVRRSEDA